MLTREQMVLLVGDLVNNDIDRQKGEAQLLAHDATLRKALALAHSQLAEANNELAAHAWRILLAMPEAQIHQLNLKIIDLEGTVAINKLCAEALRKQLAELNADLSLMTQDRDVWRSSCAQVEEERDTANKIGDTFWEALKGLKPTVLDVHNPGRHFTEAIDTLQQQLTEARNVLAELLDSSENYVGEDGELLIRDRFYAAQEAARVLLGRATAPGTASTEP